MKKLIILIAIIYSCQAVFNLTSEFEYKIFGQFVRNFKKTYKNELEKLRRFNIFKNNLILAKENENFDKNSNYGITKFSDMTPEQFQRMFSSLKNYQIEHQNKQNPSFLRKLRQSDSVLPENIDWRNKGIVSKVKVQDTCGSCWTFATTGVLQAQYALKTGKKIEFSEQQLLDCDTKNDGCQGGLMHDAYESIQQWGGIQEEKTYGSYQNQEQECKMDEQNFVANVRDYFIVDQDEELIKQYLVKYGPLACGINARYLQLYQNGIHSHQLCNDNLTHAVLVVGYGTTNDGINYWILKNQWGSDWGQNGYFRLIRGQGHCGVHTYVSGANIEILSNK